MKLRIRILETASAKEQWATIAVPNLDVEVIRKHVGKKGFSLLEIKDGDATVWINEIKGDLPAATQSSVQPITKDKTGFARQKDRQVKNRAERMIDNKALLIPAVAILLALVMTVVFYFGIKAGPQDFDKDVQVKISRNPWNIEGRYEVDPADQGGSSLELISATFSYYGEAELINKPPSARDVYSGVVARFTLVTDKVIPGKLRHAFIDSAALERKDYPVELRESGEAFFNRNGKCVTTLIGGFKFRTPRALLLFLQYGGSFTITAENTKVAIDFNSNIGNAILIKLLQKVRMEGGPEAGRILEASDDSGMDDQRNGSGN